MLTIVEVIKNLDAEYVGGVNESAIQNAEVQLSVSFPMAYKEFLLHFGVVSIGSHEIYGLGVDGYLNVVEATMSERKRNPELLNNYIVIENLATEGILILLRSNGEDVYEFVNGKINLIYDSLLEYVEQLKQ